MCSDRTNPLRDVPGNTPSVQHSGILPPKLDSSQNSHTACSHSHVIALSYFSCFTTITAFHSNHPSTMCSVSLPITFKALGSPSLAAPLELVERTVASLEPKQLLVRVSCSSINAADSVVQRDNRFKMPYPQVLGFDFSGTVVAAGSQSTADGDSSDDVQVGSRVLGISVAGGCFAEYVVVKSWQTTVQGSMRDADASTYGTAYISGALRAMVMANFPSRSGQTIFLPGGAGGVGHFVVQLAKTYGLRVIASSSKPAGLQLLRSLGADVVLDYSKQDVVAEVLAATDGKGADIVFDTVCKLASFVQSATVVKSGGHWMFLGQPHRAHTMHACDGLSWCHVRWHSLQLLLDVVVCTGPWIFFTDDEKQQVEAIVASRGATIVVDEGLKYMYDEAHRGELERQWQTARQNYEAGKVRPHISATVPFDAKQVQAALDASMQGVVGKVVVKIQ